METILAAFIIACSNLGVPTMTNGDTANKLRSECIQRVTKCTDDVLGKAPMTVASKCSKEVHL